MNKNGEKRQKLGKMDIKNVMDFLFLFLELVTNGDKS